MATTRTRERFTALATKIPGYRINYRVGQGGMGTVYHATQLSLDRPVAIKVLTRRLSRDPVMVARFEREAGALAKLSHPNIVSVYEKGQVEGTYYIIMEYIDGPSLRDIIASTPLVSEEFAKMTAQIGAALSFMHQRDIVHRDLKPSNILRDPQGNYRLSDFGLVHVLKQDVSRPSASGSLVGTPMYLAPEQLHARGEINPATDVYGFAVIVYELLTGVLPLGRFKLPNEMNASVSESLSDAVRTALARDYHERYQSIDEFLDALHQGLEESPNLRLRISKLAAEQRDASSGPGSGPSSSQDDRSEQRARVKRRVQMYTGAVVLLAFLVAAFILLYPSGETVDETPVATETRDLAQDLPWAASWTEALAEARRSGKIPMVVVTQAGTPESLDLEMSAQSADIVREGVVPVVLSLADAQRLLPLDGTATAPAVYAFNRSGEVLVRQSAFPPVAGLGSFVSLAVTDAQRIDRWMVDMDSAFNRARESRQPILLIAGVGREPEQVEFQKLEVFEEPELAALLQNAVLLSVEDPAAEEELLQQFGFFQYPLIAVVELREVRGEVLPEVVGREIVFPVTDYAPLVQSLREAQAR